MKRLAEKATQVFRWFSLVGGICIMLIVLDTTADVTGRYVAKSPLPATFEVSMILIIFVVYFSLAYCQARGSHLRLEFLWRRFNPSGQAVCDILSLLIGLFLFTLITWQGWAWTVEAWQEKTYMQGLFKIPYFPATFGFTLGAFLFSIQYLIDLVRRIGGLSRIGEIGEQH